MYVSKNMFGSIAKSGKQASAKKAMVVPFAMYFVSLLISGSTGIVASGIALPSSEIVFFRVGIAALILSTIFLMTRRKLTVFANKRELALLGTSGIAMALMSLCLYEAYQTVGVSLSTILCYCAPVIVMLLSPIIFHERLTALKLIGLATVVSGCVLVNAFAFAGGMSVKGILCGLGSAVCFAIMLVLNKKVTKTQGIERPLVQLVAAGLVLAVYICATKGFPIYAAASEWPSIIAIGIMAAAGNFLYFDSVSKLSVSSVSVFGYFEPLSTMIMGVVFLGEHMLVLQIVGAVLIIAGALFGEVCGKKRRADLATQAIS